MPSSGTLPRTGAMTATVGGVTFGAFGFTMIGVAVVMLGVIAVLVPALFRRGKSVSE